jgi:RimJ/RimL family protein N-acetyltransferase
VTGGAEVVDPPTVTKSVPDGHGVRLVTPRLVLRDVEANDILPILRYWREPESHANILSDQRDEKRIASRFQSMVNYNVSKGAWDREVFALAVCRAEDSVVLGECTIRYLDRSSMILGWHYGVEHAGQGYATEAARAVIQFAFDELGMQWVMADCFETNVAVVAVVRKLGMRRQHGRMNDWLRGFGYGEWRPAIRHCIHRDFFEPDAHQ